MCLVRDKLEKANQCGYQFLENIIKDYRKYVWKISSLIPMFYL